MRSFPKSRLYIRSTVKTFIQKLRQPGHIPPQIFNQQRYSLIREIDDITFPMGFLRQLRYSQNSRFGQDLSVPLHGAGSIHTDNIGSLPRNLMLVILYRFRFLGLVIEQLQSLFGISFHKYGTQRIISQITILDGQQTIQVISQSHPCDITMRRVSDQPLFIYARQRIVFLLVPVLLAQQTRQLPDSRIALHHCFIRKHPPVQIRIIMKQPLHARPQQFVTRLLSLLPDQQIKTFT